MPSARGPTENKLNIIFVGSFLQRQCRGRGFLRSFVILILSYFFILFMYFLFFLFNPTGPLHVYYGFQLSVSMGFLSVGTSDSLLFMSSLGFFSSAFLFCPSLMC